PRPPRPWGAGNATPASAITNIPDQRADRFNPCCIALMLQGQVPLLYPFLVLTPFFDLHQGILTVLKTPCDFLHRVGACWHLILQFDRGGHCPLVLFHHLEDLFYRCVSRPPG